MPLVNFVSDVKSEATRELVVTEIKSWDVPAPHPHHLLTETVANFL